MTVPRHLSVLGGPVDVLGRFFTPPLVTITTVGGAPVLNREDYVSATVTITRTATPYTGATQIRGRGNSTWALPKKPYRLKLTTAASLLGMPADRDWVLLANYYDQTLARTTTAMELGSRAAGLPWTPRMRNVEVVLNGDYLGAYQLGEHVKIAAVRNNISKASGTTGLGLTGGYALEIDERMEDNGDPGFRSAHDNLAVAFDDPDGSTPEQAAYIQAWVDNFETVLYGSNWLNPATGYARFIDQASFIDWYLIQELTANTDSDFYSSCKLYKTRDTADTPGRLHLGPLWDFDLSLGIEWDDGDEPTVRGRDPEAFFTRTSSPVIANKGATWIARMFGDPAFVAAAWERWNVLLGRIADGPDPVDTILDRQILALREASARDRARWGHALDPVAETDFIKAWLATRIAWLTTVLEP